MSVLRALARTDLRAGGRAWLRASHEERAGLEGLPVSSFNEQIRSALLDVSLFSDLDGETLAALTQIAYLRTVKKGEVLFRQGEPGEELLVLIRGSVTASVSRREGGTMTVGVLGPGEFFGEVALLDGFPRSATVTALEDLQLVVVDRETFTSLVHDNPPLSFALLRAMARRMRVLNEALTDIASLDVSDRLCRRLLLLARQHGSPNPHGTRITIPLTPALLGDMVGAPEETVARVLGRLEADGLIRIVDQQFHLLDIDRLSRMEPSL